MSRVYSKGLNRGRQIGVTLIELLIAIMIIAISVTGLISLGVGTGPITANAERTAQAAALAAAYIEEISSKPYADPDGVSGEALRVQFDDVFDYDTLDEQPPRAANGAVLPGLSSFRVSVTVANTAGLGPLADRVPAADAALITVRVRSEDQVDLSLHSAVTR